MKAVWKYDISRSVNFFITMPRGAQFLSIKMQFGKPVIYFLVDPTQPLSVRNFIIVGTGHKEVPDSGYMYLDTFEEAGGNFMWHVFMEDDSL